MKIKIVSYVDVDVDSYCLEYGIDKKDIRKDIKSTYEHQPQQHIEQLGLESPKRGTENAKRHDEMMKKIYGSEKA